MNLLIFIPNFKAEELKTSAEFNPVFGTYRSGFRGSGMERIRGRPSRRSHSKRHSFHGGRDAREYVGPDAGFLGFRRLFGLLQSAGHRSQRIGLLQQLLRLHQLGRHPVRLDVRFLLGRFCQLGHVRSVRLPRYPVRSSYLLLRFRRIRQVIRLKMQQFRCFTFTEPSFIHFHRIPQYCNIR